MKTHNRIHILSLLAMAPFSAGLCWASMSADLPPVKAVGPVTFVSGGGNPAQDKAMRSEAMSYPLELDFLWGRGAKETPIAGVDWSIRNPAGHVLVDSVAKGPEILASLPDGRYTVTGRYDGRAVSRIVQVQKGKHDIVPLEWPQ